MLEELKKEFESIYADCLSKKKNENDVQRFIEDNTELVPREFKLNHGIYLKTVFLKVPFGIVYKSDFMLITKSTAQWRCIHIEIENPASQPFKKDGDTSAEFSHAYDQVKSWQTWLKAPENQVAFKQQIKNVLMKYNDNPIEHKFVLVFGRRENVNNYDKKKLWASFSDDNISVMTFDSLFEDEEKWDKILHLGSFKSNCISIDKVNGDFDESWFFDTLNPSDFSFKEEDVQKMIEHRKNMKKKDFAARVTKDYDAKIIENLGKIQIRK